ncbi:hypothetical protein AB1Y20_017208 [Prymnesium parvum]|uniref:Beta-carotene isomerase D27-like C-terminal domain-containing protein n=1 Tax=Prymnesium parvum TaxID=97485 RepID=A0AB34IAZ8_PRYPA
MAAWRCLAALRLCAALSLPPPLPLPTPPASASLITPRAKQPLPAPSLLEQAAISLFRRTLRVHTNVHTSSPGYEGLLEELRAFHAVSTAREQHVASRRTMESLGIGVGSLFRRVASRRGWAPLALAAATQALLPFLVGEMELTRRAPDDPRGGGVLVRRCRVLEQGGCKGLCVQMCKLPTEELFAEQWGVPVRMAPNFETHECQISFGVVPPRPEDDPSLPRGCLTNCPIAKAAEAASPARPLPTVPPAV